MGSSSPAPKADATKNCEACGRPFKYRNRGSRGRNPQFCEECLELPLDRRQNMANERLAERLGTKPVNPLSIRRVDPATLPPRRQPPMDMGRARCVACNCKIMAGEARRLVEDLPAGEHTVSGVAHVSDEACERAQVRAVQGNGMAAPAADSAGIPAGTTPEPKEKTVAESTEAHLRAQRTRQQRLDDIIDELSNASAPVSGPDLARACDIPVGSIYSLMGTLAEQGLVERRPAGGTGRGAVMFALRPVAAADGATAAAAQADARIIGVLEREGVMRTIALGEKASVPLAELEELINEMVEAGSIERHPAGGWRLPDGRRVRVELEDSEQALAEHQDELDQAEQEAELIAEELREPPPIRRLELVDRVDPVLEMRTRYFDVLIDSARDGADVFDRIERVIDAVEASMTMTRIEIREAA